MLEDGSRLVPGGATERFIHLLAHAESGLEQLMTDVLQPLSRRGIARPSELVIAWDFHTASGASAWGDLLAMRDEAERLAGPSGLGCSVDSVIETPDDGEIHRRIEGRFRVPSFQAFDGVGAPLTRDAAGRVISNREVDAPFVALFPRSVVDRAQRSEGSSRLVSYGHGLFSSKDEIFADFMTQTASTIRWSWSRPISAV